MTIIWSRSKAQAPSFETAAAGSKDGTIQVIIEVALERVALSKIQPVGSTAAYRRGATSAKVLKDRAKERQSKLAELTEALAEIAPETKLKEIKSGNAISARLTAEQVMQLTKVPCVRAIRQVVTHKF